VDTEISCLYCASALGLQGEQERAGKFIEKLHAMNPQASIDWLSVAYPTRCFQESEKRERFLEGLRKAGLK